MTGRALRAHLLANSGVAAIVGVRVYAVILPQIPTLPCITYQQITGARSHTLDGAASPHPLFQIDCWGEGFEQANLLGDAVSSCLDGFRGSLGSLLAVTECLEINRQDLYEPETKEFRVSFDFQIWHQ